jgi:prepilin-type N-terminal cleavage/methylation domain-containing protein
VKKIKISKNYGFTLAEVLITLAIIGVVAALTIPSVVRNYQKTQTVTQLKKVYSALANTTNLAIADEGPVEGWVIDSGTDGSKAFAEKYLIPYLKVSKDCGTQTTGECQFKATSLSKQSTSTLDSTHARFYLADGTLIAVRVFIEPIYADVRVDLNGQKGPNRYGRDVFLFNYRIYNKAGFGPHCATTESRDTLLGDSASRCNKNQSGLCCATLIMKDGWQISDDYPWD